MSKSNSKSSKTPKESKGLDAATKKKIGIAIGVILLLAVIAVAIWLALVDPKTGCRRPLELCDDGECRSDCESDKDCTGPPLVCVDDRVLINPDPSDNCAYAACPNGSAPVACANEPKDCDLGGSVNRDPLLFCDYPECPTECPSDTMPCPNGTEVKRDPENKCEFFECPEGCDSDTEICWDGTVVGRDPENKCEFHECPVGCDSDTEICWDGTVVGRNPDDDCNFYDCPPVIEGCDEELKDLTPWEVTAEPDVLTITPGVPVEWTLKVHPRPGRSESCVLGDDGKEVIFRTSGTFDIAQTISFVAPSKAPSRSATRAMRTKRNRRTRPRRTARNQPRVSRSDRNYEDCAQGLHEVFGMDPSTQSFPASNGSVPVSLGSHLADELCGFIFTETGSIVMTNYGTIRLDFEFQNGSVGNGSSGPALLLTRGDESTELKRAVGPNQSFIKLLSVTTEVRAGDELTLVRINEDGDAMTMKLTKLADLTWVSKTDMVEQKIIVGESWESQVVTRGEDPATLEFRVQVKEGHRLSSLISDSQGQNLAIKNHGITVTMVEGDGWDPIS